MNFFLTIAFLFFVGSCAGWVLEVFYRRFFSAANPEHKWINPGFLTGPWVPLYGFGLSILYLFCRIDLTFVGPVWAQRLVLFVLMGLAMTLIELIAGEIFILGMHVKLWDYSHLWGNYKGIICPLFSLIWTALAIAFFYFVYPIADNAVAWLGQHITFLFVVGMFYGVFLVDFCHSVRLGARIRRFAAENDLVVKYETFKLEVRARSKKHTFFRSIAGGIAETPLFEALRAYREKYPSPLTRYRTRKEREKATSGAPQAQTSVCAQTDTPAHNNAEQNGEQKP